MKELKMYQSLPEQLSSDRQCKDLMVLPIKPM
jgi:hypothetical protein